MHRPTSGVDPPTRMLTCRAATPSSRAAAVVVVVAGRCSPALAPYPPIWQAAVLLPMASLPLMRTAGGRPRRGISGCRLSGGPGGGVGLAAQKGQGGGEGGAAAGPHGVGAAAAAGGQAGHLAQLEHEPTGGGVTAAALGGAGQC